MNQIDFMEKKLGTAFLYHATVLENGLCPVFYHGKAEQWYFKWDRLLIMLFAFIFKGVHFE